MKLLIQKLSGDISRSAYRMNYKIRNACPPGSRKKRKFVIVRIVNICKAEVQEHLLQYILDQRFQNFWLEI